MNKDDIIRMALKCGAYIKTDCEGNGIYADGIDIERFAELVAAAEREACAKVCEELGYYAKHGGWTCADVIRERGQE